MSDTVDMMGQLVSPSAWAEVWTATNASEIKTMADPVVLADGMGLDADALQRNYLEMRVTFNPNSQGSEPSIINGWQMSFSCVDNT